MGSKIEKRPLEKKDIVARIAVLVTNNMTYDEYLVTADTRNECITSTGGQQNTTIATIDAHRGPQCELAMKNLRDLAAASHVSPLQLDSSKMTGRESIDAYLGPVHNTRRIQGTGSCGKCHTFVARV